MAAFTLGAWTITFLFGLAVAVGLGDLILSLVPKPGASVKYALITAAGVVMILGGVVIVVREHALAAAVPSAEELPADRSAALIGAGLAGVELLSAFPYLAAIALIAGSGVSNAEKLSLLVLYCVIYTLPLIAIALAFAAIGEQADRALRPIGEWLMGHWPLVVGPVTGAIGAGLLAFGISQLT